MIRDPFGILEYRVSGMLHRVDGPAKIFPNGTQHWYYEGELHRIGGPAIEWATGEKHFYLHGIRYSAKDYWSKLLDEGIVSKLEAFPCIFGK